MTHTTDLPAPTADTRVDVPAHIADPTRHDFRVGDVVVGSWGYDQTNIDYYAVVRTTKAKVELRPIGAEIVSTSQTAQVVAPDPTSYREWDIQIQTGQFSPNPAQPRHTKLCSTRRTYRGEWAVTLNDRHSATRYTGPMSETAAGFGH